MERSTHRFEVAGEVIESTVITATPEEWEGSPESREARWSVLRRGATLIANAVALPGSILIPIGDVAARADRPRINYGRLDWPRV